MISLEQIRALESKVHKAVALLSAAQEENKLLKERLASYETRVDELEFMIEEFKEEQSEIEQGIISALQHLDSLEDAVGGMKTPAPSANAQTDKTASSVKTGSAESRTPAEKAEPAPAPVENHGAAVQAGTEPADSGIAEEPAEEEESAKEEHVAATRTEASWEAEGSDVVETFSDEDDSEDAQKDQRQLDIF